MKNFQKLALGLVVGALAIGSSAFTSKTVKYAGTYYYNQPSQQPWSNSNALPVDQASTHYTEFSDSPNCQISSNICTYELVGGKYVQSTKGTFN